MLNPYSPPVTSGRHDGEVSAERTRLASMLLTAVCAVGSMLVMWMLIVGLLDRRFTGDSNLLWSGSLWFSTITCVGIVAYFRRSSRPALACPIAFALFGLAFMVAEGDVSGGSDPAQASFVVWNLICLPAGACAAAAAGGWLRGRRHETHPTKEPSGNDLG